MWTAGCGKYKNKHLYIKNLDVSCVHIFLKVQILLSTLSSTRQFNTRIMFDSEQGSEGSRLRPRKYENITYPHLPAGRNPVASDPCSS